MDRSNGKDIEHLLAGRKLSPAEIESRERALEGRPDDAQLRLELLGYYSHRQGTPSRRRTSELRAWLVEHRPHSVALDVLDPPDDPERTAMAAVWMRQVRKRPEDADLVVRAAERLYTTLPLVAEDLLRPLQSDPQVRPRRARVLARVSMFHAAYAIDETSSRRFIRRAARLLREAEPEPDSFEHAVWLWEIANAYRRAGYLEKAATYATQLLSSLSSFAGTSMEGNALHEGNITLGHIALRRGDVSEARSRLLAAADIPSSPHLKSFGPSMSLAAELATAGEQDVVIAFLGKIRQIWKVDGGAMDAWLRQLHAGELPDFEPNVRY